MNRLFVLGLAMLLGLTTSTARPEDSCCPDGGGCQNRCCKCITPPGPDCPDCGDPCEKRCFKPLFGDCHVDQLIEQLGSGDCKERIKAAKKLGCCLHADFCCKPEVLEALVRAVLCDPCWEVRKTAAWAIAYQKARVPEGVLALYLAGRLDPHFMVRDAATDALDILTVCRRDCFKDLYKTTPTAGPAATPPATSPRSKSSGCAWSGRARHSIPTSATIWSWTAVPAASAAWPAGSVSPTAATATAR